MSKTSKSKVEGENLQFRIDVLPIVLQFSVPKKLAGGNIAGVLLSGLSVLIPFGNFVTSLRDANIRRKKKKKNRRASPSRTIIISKKSHEGV